MDPTVPQIEAHIDRARHELGANLKELEHRVEVATDWRSHFRARPFAFVGAGFVAGAVLGMATSIRGGRPQTVDARPVGPHVSAFLKEAVIAFTAAWLRLYINELLSESRTSKQPESV